MVEYCPEKPRKVFYDSAAIDFDVCNVLFHEFCMKCIRLWDVHHIVHEETMQWYEIRSSMLHVHSLFAVHCRVSSAFHPCGDMHVPPACCLFCPLDSLEKLETMSFLDGHRSYCLMYTTSSPMLLYSNACCVSFFITLNHGSAAIANISLAPLALRTGA